MLLSPLPCFLNLGCGTAFSSSPEWLNVDIAPHSSVAKHVRRYHLAMGIPFADNRFDGVYHSHLLEHFPRAQALPFLKECLRVLRPGGILRVVVPDLESILRQYLDALEQARQNLPGADARLLWMQVELIDQMVRRKSGGMMATVWEEADEPTAAFIRSRIGQELENIPRHPQEVSLTLPEENLRLPTVNPAFLEEGECHQWMYEEVSLTALLHEAGFTNIHTVRHHESSIPGFTLDSNLDGSARKPDSLYLEAHRPDTPTLQTPSVFMFSSSDTGGAAIAALRLHDGLRGEGKNSIAYVQRKSGSGSQIYVLPPSGDDRMVSDGQGGGLLASFGQERRRQAAALAAYPKRPVGCEAFSDSEAALRLHDVPLLAEGDIIHLHWIANFIDVPGNADFLKGKKIVWTLHDMNPFTGGCHYADSCDKYLTQCGACPQLGSDDERDMARRTWKRKDYAYRKLDITVVAPSRWLADEARKSSLMGRFPVHCIPYGLPTDVFKPYTRLSARELLGWGTDSRVLLFSADGVLNRRKGLSYLLEALGKLHAGTATEKTVLAVMGSGGDQLQGLPYPLKILGRVNTPHIMALVYSAADALVLPTLEDNLPNVLLESLACGTPAVSFRVGGVPEIVEHGRTGWLASPRNVEELAQCLHKALTDNAPNRRALCRAKALESYALPLQAQRYAELYRTLLNR